MKKIILLITLILASSLISVDSQDILDGSIEKKSLRYYMYHLNRILENQSIAKRMMPSKRQIKKHLHDLING